MLPFPHGCVPSKMSGTQYTSNACLNEQMNIYVDMSDLHILDAAHSFSCNDPCYTYFMFQKAYCLTFAA